MKKLWSYLGIIVSAVLLACVYYIFITPNHFAPAGLNGIATMIQFKTGFSISYMSLLINIPLSVLAYFLVQKDFAVKTLLFSIIYSVSLLALQHSELTFIQYRTFDHDTIYPVILSGVLSGIVNGVCFRNNGSTGGTDILSRYINKKQPGYNFFAVTFILNATIAVSSIFVYADETLSYKPAALCILFCFISSFVGNLMLKNAKTAYKFTVITDNKDQLIGEITHTLHHSCTEISATGSYSGQPRYVLICIINKHQLNDFQKIVSKYSNTFSYFETVNEIYGNFRQVKKIHHI